MTLEASRYRFQEEIEEYGCRCGIATFDICHPRVHFWLRRVGWLRRNI